MSHVRRFWVLVLGILFVVLGVVAEVRIAPTESFGWTAFAPLTSTTFTPSWAPFEPYWLIGTGAILIAGWVGFRLGRRSRRT
jgi:heme/copper-type cytochrome/quinol oxidase subunit 1